MEIKTHRNGAARQHLHFTAAEKRVLVFLPTHLTEEAIAERLGRRRSTVKTHVAHIYKKLGARSRGEAVARAQKRGLLPEESKTFDASQTFGMDRFRLEPGRIERRGDG